MGYYNDGKQWLFKCSRRKRPYSGLVSEGYIQDNLLFWNKLNPWSWTAISGQDQGMISLTGNRFGSIRAISTTITGPGDLENIYKVIDLKTSWSKYTQQPQSAVHSRQSTVGSQVGSPQSAVHSRQSTVGSPSRQSTVQSRQSGNLKTEDWKTEDWRLETETGDWKLKTEDWRLKICFSSRNLYLSFFLTKGIQGFLNRTCRRRSFLDVSGSSPSFIWDHLCPSPDELLVVSCILTILFPLTRPSLIIADVVIILRTSFWAVPAFMRYCR